MNIKKLGTINDKMLFFGGVYGNLHALKSLQNIALQKDFKPNQIIFNGDSAAYCAHPEESVQVLKNWGIHAVAGNIEIQLREGSSHCGCNFQKGTVCDKLSKGWYPYIQQRLTDSSFNWMKTLPHAIRFKMNKKLIMVVHGAFSNVSRYIFKSTGWDEKKRELEAAGSDIIISGHCGIPFNDQQNGSLWINTGAVGMPANEGSERVWYLTVHPMNSGKIRFQHHTFRYDNKAAAEAMNRKGLAEEYRETLINGIWNNCAILPEMETGEQGRLLNPQEVIIS